VLPVTLDTEFTVHTHDSVGVKAEVTMVRKAIFLAGMMALCFAQPASAGDGWYLGLGAGWSALDPVGFNVSAPVGPASGRITFGDTASVHFAVGYKFNFPIRLETEIQYADFDANHLKFSGAPVLNAGGDLAMTSVFVNGIYDIPLSRHFAFSIGGGLGVAQADANLSDTLGARIGGSNATFTWQALAGFNVALADKLDLGVEYRYQSADATGHNFLALINAPASLKAKNSQTVMLNLRWYVNGPPAPPPPPPVVAPPPPAPPPPPPVKDFIVFFDFDKSDLTAEAVNVVAEAASTAKIAGVARIQVTGHTDTVGSAQYNQALSEKRAASVKTELVKDGLNDAEITTSGKGFADLLIQTAPDVREPQNRRAVIAMGSR
jgi:outer membrane protein OmpA-like peptidoglycan-associated protein